MGISVSVIHSFQSLFTTQQVADTQFVTQFEFDLRDVGVGGERPDDISDLTLGPVGEGGGSNVGGIPTTFTLDGWKVTATFAAPVPTTENVSGVDGTPTLFTIAFRLIYNNAVTIIS